MIRKLRLFWLIFKHCAAASSVCTTVTFLFATRWNALIAFLHFLRLKNLYVTTTLNRLATIDINEDWRLLPADHFCRQKLDYINVGCREIVDVGDGTLYSLTKVIYFLDIFHPWVKLLLKDKVVKEASPSLQFPAKSLISFRYTHISFSNLWRAYMYSEIFIVFDQD